MTWEQQKAEREEKATLKFQRTLKRMRADIELFIHGQIDRDELSERLSKKDVTKLALFIHIMNDAKSRKWR